MTVKRTFYWFDYETFGLDKGRDRPAQFAGLRTDENLNEIGRRDVFYCLAAEDYLPSPQSCLITGITPLTCFDDGDPEAVFANKIFERLNQPGTISVGYNNFSFDDHVCRYLFFRNLIDPYKREYGDGKARLDLYQIVIAAYAFKNDILRWPRTAEGNLVLRLEELTKANGLTHEHAHDAMSDTLATMLLAKAIKTKEPKFWDYAVSLSSKAEVKKFFSVSDPLIYVDRSAGEARRFLRAIYPICENPSKPNEWLCWDLCHDPQELFDLTADDVAKRLYVSKEDRAKGVAPIPLVRVRINNAPFVIRVPKTFDKRFGMTLGLSYAELLQRATVLKNGDYSFLDSLLVSISETESRFFNLKGEEIETSLYSGGFLSNSDRNTLERLRAKEPEEIAEEYGSLDFDNPELTHLIRRYLARNFPYVLSAEDALEWRRYREDHLITGKDNSRTFESFFEEISRLREEYPQKEGVLDELEEYGREICSEFGAG